MYVSLYERKYLKGIKIGSKLQSDDYNEFYDKLERELIRVVGENKPTALIFGIPEHGS
jgi:hypothetical protein